MVDGLDGWVSNHPNALFFFYIYTQKYLSVSLFESFANGGDFTTMHSWFMQPPTPQSSSSILAFSAVNNHPLPRMASSHKG